MEFSKVDYLLRKSFLYTTISRVKINEKGQSFRPSFVRSSMKSISLANYNGLKFQISEFRVSLRLHNGCDDWIDVSIIF